MKHLIIYTHPNPKSFCHAILDTVVSTLGERGDDVVVTDLYEKNFSPALAASDFIAFGKGEIPADILKEQEQVARADNLIFIYPTWWFNRPAMLQGWIDRVLFRGFAYNADENGFEALLSGKTCNLFVTFGGAEKDIVAALGSMEAAMSDMTIGTLGLVGIDPIKPHYLFEVPTITDEQRHSMLDQVKQTLTS
jgi:NAD(P)H dehydrogenase (quinone)